MHSSSINAAANRLTNVVQGTTSASLFYDDAGRRTKLTLPNGVNVLYAYDIASRLTNITYQAAVTNQIAYRYDQAGNRVAQSSQLSVFSLPSSVSTSSYNAANQQLVFGSYNLLYDAAGNVTNIVSGTSTNRLYWNARNQLTNVGAAVSAAFVYDGLGRRVTRTVSAVTEKYLYDGLDTILTKDSSGSIVTRYFRGLAIDEPWQRIDVASKAQNNTNRVYLADALGSIVALTDPNKAIQTEYDYQPFGATSTTGQYNRNSYRFTAREDDGTGLYYYRYRYYHPALGRFIAEDPLRFAGGDYNLYANVWNDPITFRDPLGLWGVQFGNTNLGAGNPWLIFDQGSWGDLGRGMAATADGIIPFADPFSQYYDPCDPVFMTSRALGAFSRDLLVTAYIPNFGAWAKNPVLYEIGSTTVPSNVYGAMKGLNAVQKGRYLFSNYGLGGTLRLNYQALKAGEFTNTIGTFGTPGANLILLGIGQAFDSASESRCGCK
jgi:RHS repeat-associated protein